MTRDLPGGRGGLIPSLLLAASFLLLSGSACAPQPLTVTREPSTLRLVAADSCQPLVRKSAGSYEAAHPWVTVTFDVFNNALAADALRGSEADLALLSWEPGSAEKEFLWVEPLARDGVAVIVHPSSAFSSTDLAQLREIFRGRLQERHGVVLTVVSREYGSGTRAAFEGIVLEGEATTLNAVVVPSSEAMIDFVASTPGAIGYVSTRRLDDRVRTLPVEGVLPTEKTIGDGSYPLWRELHLASSGEPAGEARQFAQWLLRGGAEMADGRRIRVVR